MLYDTGATTPKITIYEVREKGTRKILERTNIERDAKDLADTHEADVWIAGQAEPHYVGRPKPTTVPEGCLTSSQVAERWGCHAKTVEYRMGKMGFSPVEQVYLGRARDRLWRSEDVTAAIRDWQPYARRPRKEAAAEMTPEAAALAEDVTDAQADEFVTCLSCGRKSDPDIGCLHCFGRKPDHHGDWPDGFGPGKIPVWVENAGVASVLALQEAARRSFDREYMETPSPSLLELIADRVDRLQIDVSRLGAGLARLDAEPDPDELARLRRPVSAAALARIVATLGDVDVDAAGPWLVLRRPGSAEGVAA